MVALVVGILSAAVVELDLRDHRVHKDFKAHKDPLVLKAL